MATAPTVRSARDGRPAPVKGGRDREFRPDIQGLRAIAVVMVVVYHLYPNALPGGFAGVDVFFVISGYLITGHLWRGYAATGKVPLVDFWGRRARRLVPAAAVVLLVTWIAARIVLPSTRLADTAQQVLASALYFQNWQLAHDSVDYLRSSASASPVQHFWSLSVEEQFYLVWPLLFILAALAAAALTRARKARSATTETTVAPENRVRRAVVAVLTTALVAGSLAYSVWDTNHDPASAYFVTTTRMWELGVGGLLALAPGAAGRWLGRQGWLAWLGLAAVAVSAFTLTGSMRFPGDLALLPVLGSAAIIAGGGAEGRLAPGRMLALRPMVFLGGISYSLYLWHYPVISLFGVWHDKTPGLVTGPVLIVVCVGLAWLSKTFVEDPVRLARVLRGHAWRSVSVALTAAVPVALVAVYIVTEPGPWHGRLGPGNVGAAILAAGDHSQDYGRQVNPPGTVVLPPPAGTTTPGYWDNCLDGQHAAAPKPCVFGDTKDPVKTVVLIGDSIAGDWWEPLNVIAKQRHWKLVTELHATCAWSETPALDDNRNQYPQCTSWGHTVLHDLLSSIRPQLVITSSSGMESAAGHLPGAESHRLIGEGEAAYWKQLQAHGIKVVDIREAPKPGIAGPSCVAQYGVGSPHCDAARSTSVVSDPPSATAAKLTGVPVVNMNDLICTGQVCPSAVGNVIIYFDNHHITQEYGQTLAPYLEQRLLATGAVPDGQGAVSPPPA